MAEAKTGGRPFLKVLGFRTTYDKIPVKGDPLKDTLDEKGYKLDAGGKRVMEVTETHWVKYGPLGGMSSTINEERIRHIEITPEMLDQEPSDKLENLKLKWAAIEPEYLAWKSGNQVPVNGTPLGAWAGVTAEKAEVLRRVGIRTVEDVAYLAESQMEKIQLPNMRVMRREALLFIENRGAADSAAREVERDKEIANQSMQIADLNEKLQAAMELLEKATNPQQIEQDELSSLRAELDRRGIKYHHKAGIETLRGLLNEQQAA
jgi:hypothetical protein